MLKLIKNEKKIAWLLLKCYLDNVLMGLDVMLFKMVWFPISLSHTFYIKIHNKIKYNFMPFPKMLLKRFMQLVRMSTNMQGFWS